MFERRLKIFLAAIVTVSVLLMLRTLQIQVVRAGDLKKVAERRSERVAYLETVRGRLLDVKGREIAREVPCIDAAVDYRAIGIEPDADWLNTIATARLTRRLADDFTRLPRSKRAAMVKDELPAVRHDIADMWAALSACPGMSEQKIDEIRQSIVAKVDARQHAVAEDRYEAAVKKMAAPTTRPWYARWLFDDARPPDRDQFFVKIDDEMRPQTIVANLDPQSITRLGKNLDHFPGLSLVPSTHREYPYHDVGCHVIGYLAPAVAEDLAADVNKNDPTRKYEAYDEVGRSGLEKLAEPALRGSRGRVVEDGQTGNVLESTPAEAGADVRTTIDFDLQAEIQKAFFNLEVPHQTAPTDKYPVVYGAAVVLDVPTGQVRALASNPVFDLNDLTPKRYAELASNKLDRVLRNRATLEAVEPGSTVKPAIGLWGMTCGVLGVNETIACDGFLHWGPNKTKYSFGRCWVAVRMFDKDTHSWPNGLPINHPIPPTAPLNHPLTFADALERSCNPFHETVALRLGTPRVIDGLSNFGLGRPTGIGIGEASGMLPHTLNDLWTNAMAGIGQGEVHATPIQMANLAATVGRGGVWMRPRLICDDPVASAIKLPPLPDGRPDRFDLHIPPDAIAMAKEGMFLVVHGGAASTGGGIQCDSLDLCGKTGTAQIGHIQIPKHDANGNEIPLLNPDGSPVMKNGKPAVELEDLELSTTGHINPIAPWYIGGGTTGKDSSHAWYIGFVPREKPKIAFAVLIEYGGSGGGTAAVVAHNVLQACLDQHYLSQDDYRHE